MKYIAIYFFCFLIFCAWRWYEQHKSEKIEKKSSDDFWAREREANGTRKKDISHLPLLQVKESDIPIATTANESILYYIDQLGQIIKTPMIDLSDLSNTELKLAYGVANFKVLSEYDENYSTFLLTLTNLARCYSQENLYSESADCYKLALYYGSKQFSDYTELAEVYLRLGTPEAILPMIQKLEEGCHPRKDSIIEALRQIQNKSPEKSL